MLPQERKVNPKPAKVKRDYIPIILTLDDATLLPLLPYNYYNMYIFQQYTFDDIQNLANCSINIITSSIT